MRSDHTTTPFDVEADDLTHEFWGSSRGWVSSEQPATQRSATRLRSARRRSDDHRDDTSGSMRAIRDGFAALRPQTTSNPTGQIDRRRRHGEPTRGASARREATLGELAAGHADVGGWLDDADTAWDQLGWDQPHAAADRPDAASWHAGVDDGRPHPRSARQPGPDTDVPLTPVAPLAERLGLGAVDPLLLRAGAVLMALLLLVPVVLSLRPDRADSLPTAVAEASTAPPTGAMPAEPSADPTVSLAADVPLADSTAVPVTTSAATGAADSTAAASTMAVADPTGAGAATDAVTGRTADGTDDDRSLVETAATDSPVDDGASVGATAERVVPACPQTYTAAPGDSWFRIADAAGISMTDLLAENTATTDAVILPGDEICLPAEATVPSPPTTTAPSTTEPDADAPPSTTAPTTTTPTTSEPPAENLSRAEVQELIRQTWPADEVDTALAIARRESNFIATADNGWCCVGVFQIYWTVHRSWLDDFGIHERSDLYDARKNIAAAHHLWQQSGWGPWGG